jgi:hypothetical protein
MFTRGRCWRRSTAGLSAWCMFDNMAASNATGNALSLMARVLSRQVEPPAGSESTTDKGI